MAKSKYARSPDHGKPPRWSSLYDRYCPEHTDPWSRHVKVISENLRNTKSEIRKILIDAGYDPDHWAHSMEVTVTRLWQERAVAVGPTTPTEVR